LIAGIVVLIAFFLCKAYIFGIYEVNFETHPERLYADNQSTLQIKAVPLNSLVWKSPFRNAPIEFEIKEGNELIDVLTYDKEKGVFVIKAKERAGKVVISAKSRFSLLPTEFEIIIEPNAA